MMRLLTMVFQIAVMLGSAWYMFSHDPNKEGWPIWANAAGTLFLGFCAAYWATRLVIVIVDLPVRLRRFFPR
jgi:uncharacterized protein YceK